VKNISRGRCRRYGANSKKAIETIMNPVTIVKKPKPVVQCNIPVETKIEVVKEIYYL